MTNRLRSHRSRAGLSQGELAERAQLTRQSIGAIEAGRAVPSVEIALRLARTLGCSVEELFGASEQERVNAVPSGPAATGRAALAYIRGRWVSLPLDEERLRLSADGMILQAEPNRVSLEPLRPLAESRENLVLTGCAPALGLLVDRLNTGRAAGRFLWFSGSSTAALSALSQGTTHVAGVHLMHPKTGRPHLDLVRRSKCGEPLVIVTMAHWQVGLLVRSADASRIRGPADLGRRGLRIVLREPGAGARLVLERLLADEGLTERRSPRTTIEARSHLEVARLVASGMADTGVATRDAALAFGLHFVPLNEERYDLVFPRALLGDQRVERFLNELVTKNVRRELEALGYDLRDSGTRAAEIPD